MIQMLRDFFSPEQRRVIGAEAKQALENKYWNDAFDAVEGYLIDKARATEPTDKDRAQSVIIALQLLESIKREMVRKIQDGEVAQVEIEQIEKAGKRRVFSR